MVVDIKATFSKWIKHIRDNKGKCPKIVKIDAL